MKSIFNKRSKFIGAMIGALLLCSGITSCGPDSEPAPEPSGDFADDSANASELWVISEMVSSYSYDRPGWSDNRTDTETRFTYSRYPIRIDELSETTTKYNVSSGTPYVYSETDKYTYSQLSIFVNGSNDFTLVNGLLSTETGIEGYSRYSADKHIEYEFIDLGDDNYIEFTYKWNDGNLIEATHEETDTDLHYTGKYRFAYLSDTRISPSCYRILNSIILAKVFNYKDNTFGYPVLTFGGYHGSLPKQLISEVSFSSENNRNEYLYKPALFEFKNIDQNGCPRSLTVKYNDNSQSNYSFKWIKL